MSTASDIISKDTKFFGHPAGLSTLFFTELWERMSYYGMRAILVLYMVNVLQWPNKRAGAIYGAYTGGVYLLGLPGGWIADNVLGARRAVLLGGIVIALGHFALVFSSEPFFFAGLVLIVLGTGLLKPNISSMVGGLYKQGDVRRDSGFSIFYMGINIGALIAPLVCGYFAQSEVFKSWLHSRGLNPESSWHWGFGAAGIGMTFGLIQYVLGKKNLESVGHSPEKYKKPQQIFLVLLYLIIPPAILKLIVSYGDAFWSNRYVVGTAVAALIIYGISRVLKNSSFEESKRLLAVVIFFVFSALFWAAFEQAGSSLNLFADQLTDNKILGISFPSSYHQAANPLFIILFAPIFAWLWIKLKDKQPSSPSKFSIGLLFTGLGFAVIAYAGTLTVSGKVSPYWLIAVYLLHTIGELCLSPVGLSTMTKLAPARLAGLVMGIWFLGPAVGNYASGVIAGHFEATPEAVSGLFSQVALVTISGAVVLALLVPLMRKLMGGVK